MARAAGWIVQPIFITSTFRDLHAERDWLRDVVFPELADRLRPRRVHLEPIDLRLGVDTVSEADADAKELQVLKVCLAEIERSRPYLVALIGDRYGWVPPRDRLRAAAAEAGFAGDVAGASVTELEITYGVLASKKQRNRSYFYLRHPLPYAEMDAATAAQYSEAHATDPEAPDRAKRLGVLKERIEATLPDRRRPYRAEWDRDAGKVTDLKAFGDLVLKDLWGELESETRDREGAPPPTWQDEERHLLEEFVEERTRGFVGRTKELAELKAFATGDGPSGLCLTGEAGSGKSALLARLYRELVPVAEPEAASDEPVRRASGLGMLGRLFGARPSDAAEGRGPTIGPLVLYHAAGVSPRASRVEAMLRRFAAELAAELRARDPLKDGSTAEEIEEAFRGLLHRAAAAGRRVVVLIDALDQFEATTQARHLNWIPKNWPANARLIATAIPGDASAAFAGRAGFAHRALAPMEEGAAREMIGEIYRRYHREPNKEVAKILVEKPARGNPLWLGLAVHSLNLLDQDDFEAADRTIEGTPEERLHRFVVRQARELPDDTEAAYDWLFDRASGLHGRPQVEAFLALVAASRAGLRESDLAALIAKITRMGQGWDALRFAGLRRTLLAHLVRRGAQGQWDFAHTQMRRAASARYLADAEKLRDTHRDLATHFLALPAGDALHQTETLVHLIAADDQERAARYYSGELSEAELNGATAALADTVVLKDEAGAKWVAGLLMQPLAEANLGTLCGRVLGARRGILLRPLAEANLGTLCRRFIFDLDSALAYRTPLGPRALLGDASRGALERLARQDPGNGDWQRDLSVSHERIGEVRRAQGDLAGALASHRASLEISERLARLDQGNSLWQHDLVVSHLRSGDVRLFQGDLAGALASHRASLEISERLARKDPGNSDWQRDLAVSHDKIGDVRVAQGDVAGALASHRASQEIAERLARLDPGNSLWQRDLSMSHNKIGDVLRVQGDLAGALASHRASLEIREQLARQDPGNSNSQRDLAVSHDRIGDVLKVQGDLAGGLASYRASHEIAERLARQDPGNSDWQRDLSASHEKIGVVREAQGDLAGALASYRASHEIAERLARQYPGHSTWQRDLAVSHYRLGITHERAGDRGASRNHLARCAGILRTMSAAGMHMDSVAKHVLAELESEGL